jgi:DNA-binding NarL/FixJ family response regulator
VAGKSLISPALADRMADMLSRFGRGGGDVEYDGLTKREVEILRMVAGGIAGKQIAIRLGISEKTVRNHVSNIYKKLNIFDRAQAVLYAVRKGLVPTSTLR